MLTSKDLANGVEQVAVSAEPLIVEELCNQKFMVSLKCLIYVKKLYL